MKEKGRGEVVRGKNQKRNMRGRGEENLPDKDNRSMKSKQDEFLLGSVLHLVYSTLHHGPR